MRFAPLCLLALAPVAAACSSDPKVLNISVETGWEKDAMKKAPAVARVEVRGEGPEGVEIKAEAVPGGELDFGEVDGDLAYTFEVTGVDEEGNKVMRGRSMSNIILNGVGGDTLPLFAQRLGEWGRPRGGMAHSHIHAPAVSVGERYLFMTGGEAAGGGSAAEIDQYDLFAWAGLQSSTRFDFAAQTLVSGVSAVLGLSSDGQAGWFNGTTVDLIKTLPEGLESFDEVAGGAVVLEPKDDGRAFIIGCTRPDGPTDKVLEISADASETKVLRLSAARAGAAATWLRDVGLVIIGGSADGNGVELLFQDGTAFIERDFPPDATAGAAAIDDPSSPGSIALIGGTLAGAGAPTRHLDPRCNDNCLVEEIEGVTPGPALTRVSAFINSYNASPSKGRAIVIGDEVGKGGMTLAFMIDFLEPKVTPLPLKEPRRGATAVPAPNGTLALLGGVEPDGTPVLTVEMLFIE